MAKERSGFHPFAKLIVTVHDVSCAEVSSDSIVEGEFKRDGCFQMEEGRRSPSAQQLYATEPVIVVELRDPSFLRQRPLRFSFRALYLASIAAPRSAARKIVGILATILFSLCAASLSCASVRGAVEPYSIQSWQTDEGLPDNSATAMVQTPDGYLWFGTFSGLVRFDGVRFVVFDSSNTPSLPGSGIVNLHLDSLNRLWVSTLAGLVVSEPNVWTDFRVIKEWTGDYVRTFSERAGLICITSFDGKVFRASGDEFTELPRPPGKVGAGYFGHVDSSGRIHVVQNRFFGRWSGKGWEESELSNIVTNRFQAACSARDGSLLVYVPGKLLRIEAGSLRVESQVPREFHIFNVWQMNQTAAGTVWISTSHNGLFEIPQSGNVRRHNTASGLPYDSLRFTFEDSEKNLWIGSSGGGLSRFKRRTFINYDLADGLPERAVKAVVEDSSGSGILIGTHGKGLAMLKSNRVFSLFRTNEPGRFPPYVQCLLRDREGDVWAGAFQGGLIQIKGSKWERIPDILAGGPSISALFQDSRGRIWIGGSESVSLFENGTFSRDGEHPHLREIRCFAEDPADGSILGGNETGLYRHREGTWHEVKAAGKSIQRITYIRTEENGTVWAAASGTGLLRLRTNSAVTLTEKHGLPSRNVASFIPDNHGYWWLGSDRGVFRVQKQALDRVADGSDAQLEAQLFTRNDGLGTIGCTAGYQSTTLKDHCGKIYFATGRGLAVVDPGELHVNTNTTRIHFETVAYTDQRGQRKTIVPFREGTVPIPAGSRQIEVYVAALCFTAAENVQIRYSLVGQNKLTPAVTQRQRLITLGWLAPGMYTLDVSAANNSGIWSTKPEVLTLVVQPFFWQTTGFLASSGLFLAVAIGFSSWRVTRSRARAQISQLKQQHAIEHERARLGSILEATSDFVAFCDPEGKVLYVNAAGRRMAGLPIHEQEPELHIPDFHPRWATERVLQDAIPVAKQKGIWSGETALLHRDGRELPVSQVIVAHRDPEGTLKFLSTIARDISERKRAEDDLRLANERLQRLSEHLLEIQESERRFIARELHDEIGQALTAATLNFQGAKSGNDNGQALEDGILILDGVLRLVRDLSLDLRPSMLDHVGLAAAVRWQVDRIAQRSGFKAEIVSDNCAPHYRPELEIACYRIVQEALTNIARHAQAKNVRVELASLGDSLCIIVRDDGCGFDVPAVRNQCRSFGIFGIEERAALLGGECSIDSSPGCGTIVCVQLPIADA